MSRVLRGIGCQPLKEKLRSYQLEATETWGAQVAKIARFAKTSIIHIYIYIYIYIHKYIYIYIYIYIYMYIKVCVYAYMSILQGAVSKIIQTLGDLFVFV